MSLSADIASTEPATDSLAAEGSSSSEVVIDQQIISQNPITKEESLQSMQSNFDHVAADEDGEIFFKTKVRFDIDNAAGKEKSTESEINEKSVPEDRSEIKTDEFAAETTPITLDDNEDEAVGEEPEIVPKEPKSTQEELDYENNISEGIYFYDRKQPLIVG